MNRRNFAKNLAFGALGAGAVGVGEMRGDALFPARGEATTPADAGVPFQLSVMLWTVFTKLPFEERLEKVASAGYTNVELVGEFQKWNDDHLKSALAARRRLGMQFDATGGISKWLSDPSQRDAFLAEVKSILVTMEKIECSRLIILTGNKMPSLSHEQQHASCVEGLKRAGDLAAERNMKILLENIDPEENPKYFLTSVTEGFDVIREVNHPHVRFLYDFFHEQISEGNLIEKLDKNIDLIDLVHIADVPGRHEPGTGEINYFNIYKKLISLGYDRYAAMEFMPTGDQVESLKTAREMVLKAGAKA